ncbi:hypothetical protein [Bradyrhizobium vignae]|uniref:hypothetical protein n=1 Tax=Bradyrhizobium vignae TaxID=1549949 RepID=UPI00100BD29B|nr:hypothetical protein [Bradyrhizobium vignae]RXG97456.1 hypothetical protein EAV90_22555 [Bradyrhizobium vignae]
MKRKVIVEFGRAGNGELAGLNQAIGTAISPGAECGCDLVQCFVGRLFRNAICGGARYMLGLAELALHVVPCLARYTFGRREELCGVDVDDVLEEDGIPYIFIRPNEHRTLKNPQSMRRVPLIGDVVRLGFLQYHALKKLGHKLLFPKLRAASDRTPLGDTFYGDWTKVQSVAGPTPPSRRRFSIRFARAEAPGIVRVELGQPPGRFLSRPSGREMEEQS